MGDAGLDPTPLDRLLWAAQKGTLDDVKKVVTHFPGIINHKGGPESVTALITAAKDGRRTVVEFLIQRGSQVNATDSHKRTALHWACWYGHEPVVRVLLLAGADPTLAAMQGWTGLMEAAERGHSPLLIELLLNKDRRTLEQRTSKGRTPLWLAACEGRERVVRVLLRWRADTRAADTDGLTPLGIALEWRHHSCAKLIQEAEKMYELVRVRRLLEDVAAVTEKRRDGEDAEAVKRRRIEAIPPYWTKARMQRGVAGLPQVRFHQTEGYGTALEKAAASVAYIATGLKKELFRELVKHFQYA